MKKLKKEKKRKGKLLAKSAGIKYIKMFLIHVTRTWALYCQVNRNLKQTIA